MNFCDTFPFSVELLKFQFIMSSAAVLQKKAELARATEARLLAELEEAEHEENQSEKTGA